MAATTTLTATKSARVNILTGTDTDDIDRAQAAAPGALPPRLGRPRAFDDSPPALGADTLQHARFLRQETQAPSSL
jgi:hypothetical protein